jgi:8-oxo-dGTP pyrophosphatase MutT (NUDIX family)
VTINLWGDERRSYRLAAAVYALRDGQIAVLERSEGAMIGFWTLPGGMVDPGEDPQTAAVRELKEESGLVPTGPVEYLTALPLQAYGFDILRFSYVAECASGEIRVSDEHSGSKWIAPRDYREQHLNDAELARWAEESAHDGFNILASRVGLDALIAHLEASR